MFIHRVDSIRDRNTVERGNKESGIFDIGAD